MTLSLSSLATSSMVAATNPETIWTSEGKEASALERGSAVVCASLLTVAASVEAVVYLTLGLITFASIPLLNELLISAITTIRWNVSIINNDSKICHNGSFLTNELFVRMIFLRNTLPPLLFANPPVIDREIKQLYARSLIWICGLKDAKKLYQQVLEELPAIPLRFGSLSTVSTTATRLLSLHDHLVSRDVIYFGDVAIDLSNLAQRIRDEGLLNLADPNGAPPMPVGGGGNRLEDLVNRLRLVGFIPDGGRGSSMIQRLDVDFNEIQIERAMQASLADATRPIPINREANHFFHDFILPGVDGSAREEMVGSTLEGFNLIFARMAFIYVFGAKSLEGVYPLFISSAGKTMLDGLRQQLRATYTDLGEKSLLNEILSHFHLFTYFLSAEADDQKTALNGLLDHLKLLSRAQDNESAPVEEDLLLIEMREVLTARHFETNPDFSQIDNEALIPSLKAYLDEKYAIKKREVTPAGDITVAATAQIETTREILGKFNLFIGHEVSHRPSAETDHSYVPFLQNCTETRVP